MNLNLQDKVIVISGGAKGIGEGITTLLAQEGAIPVIIGRDENDNNKLIEIIQAKGLKAGQVVAELSDPLQCENAIKKIVAQYGHIDGLINNAGVNDSVNLENGNYENFMSSLQKNVVHYYLLAHHALPYLKLTKGSIVNIGSKVAETGQGATSGYAAANGARNALTREWAVELLKYDIRVNAVIVAECYTPLYEKWIKTLPNPEEKLAQIQSKIPLGKRFTTKEEIANTVAFLLSSVSSHTTGQLVYVDGGYTHLDKP
ncbi:MAG: SDR family oxidoreductase [Sediminibacterium sp.]|jgi:L-fucose dehydrogenase